MAESFDSVDEDTERDEEDDLLCTNLVLVIRAFGGKSVARGPHLGR